MPRPVCGVFPKTRERRALCPVCAAAVRDARGAAKPRGPGMAGDGAAAPKLGTGVAVGAGQVPWLQGQAAL